MKQLNANFIVSAEKLSQCPPFQLPEFPMLGRSNVGKSSFINALANNKKLAKTSNTPGKTRLINFFNFSDKFTIAYLPGYGYAKISAESQAKWQNYLEEYMKYATEVGEVSLRTEPGVLTMYAVSEKENPGRITILETYASQEAYKSHIASEHFQKYKQGTLHMVKTLVLSDQMPLNPANCINNFIQ